MQRSPRQKPDFSCRKQRHSRETIFRRSASHSRFHPCSTWAPAWTTPVSSSSRRNSGNALNVPIHKLPIAGAAPEWYSQKAVSIGAYFVASGVYTVLGVMPHIAGSPAVVSLLTDGLKGAVNANFAVEPDPVKAAALIESHIEQKRVELGI